MKYKDKLLDEALDRILSGPIGRKKQWQFDQSMRMQGDQRNKGKKRTEAQKKANGDRKRGKKLSEEHKRKITQGLLRNNFKQTKKHKRILAESKYVPVIATCKKTGQEYQFKSQQEAADKLDLNFCNISSVIRGRQNSTGGYFFRKA